MSCFTGALRLAVWHQPPLWPQLGDSGHFLGPVPNQWWARLSQQILRRSCLLLPAQTVMAVGWAFASCPGDHTQWLSLRSRVTVGGPSQAAVGTCPALHDMWASQVLQALLKPCLELHSTAEGSGLMWNRRQQGEERGRG